MNNSNNSLLNFKKIYMGVTAVLILVEGLLTYNMYKTEAYNFYKDIFIINIILLISNILIEVLIFQENKIGRILAMIKTFTISLSAIYCLIIYIPEFIRFYHLNTPDSDGLAALSLMGSFVTCWFSVVILVCNIASFIYFKKSKKLYK